MEVKAAIERRPTRQVMVGSVAVGGDAPITVQSMTVTRTADHEATLQQIYDLAMAGADIVRCTCNEIEAAEGLARIVPRSPVPIVADIHHQYRMALAALEAGVKAAEASLILADNHMMRSPLEKMGARIYKTYRSYEARL